MREERASKKLCLPRHYVIGHSSLPAGAFSCGLTFSGRSSTPTGASPLVPSAWASPAPRKKVDNFRRLPAQSPLSPTCEPYDGVS